MESSLRSRKSPSGSSAPSNKSDASRLAPSTSTDDDDDQIVYGISFVDMLRVLSGIVVLSCLLSWFITDGESFTWGYRPHITRWRTIKGLFQPTLHLTESELALYNGKDETKPVYVAVNGSVFDVSANRLTYGPLGGYHFFAGRDAARAFVTGCFQTDLTWDLRGLEEKYITDKEREMDDKDAAEINELERTHGHLLSLEIDDMDSVIFKAQSRLRYLKNRRLRRRQEAWESVKDTIDHWDSFFRYHKKYFYVGTVDHDYASLVGKPVPELCGGKSKPS
ncbi:cytochrome b5 [Ascodesmis nigricans]|uniref:Cytochrome b5 n=1 Tax=Ascodesmis nigricans TaxID=341454 RepID=A0A4S2MTL6_9PEZI|nr:cytochrome b5 [Ascodesmis nigricans]